MAPWELHLLLAIPLLACSKNVSVKVVSTQLEGMTFTRLVDEQQANLVPTKERDSLQSDEGVASGPLFQDLPVSSHCSILEQKENAECFNPVITHSIMHEQSSSIWLMQFNQFRKSSSTGLPDT